jgi:chloramphenicol 3-O phosphotransferase
VQALNAEQVFFISVKCPLPIVEAREKKRGDRHLNSAKAQFPLVHAPTRIYDLEVDTSQSSSLECSQQILDFVTQHPTPTGFKEMHEIFQLKPE